MYPLSKQGFEVHATRSDEAVREHADAVGTDTRCQGPLPYHRSYHLRQ